MLPALCTWPSWPPLPVVCSDVLKTVSGGQGQMHSDRRARREGTEEAHGSGTPTVNSGQSRQTTSKRVSDFLFFVTLHVHWRKFLKKMSSAALLQDQYCRSPTWAAKWMSGGVTRVASSPVYIPPLPSEPATIMCSLILPSCP